MASVDNPRNEFFKIVSTDSLRERIRYYKQAHREHQRADVSDTLRFGLGEIQQKIEKLDSLTEQDVNGLAVRIKRRKHADVEDMYRLSHAFLQSIDNIRKFATIPGALQVLIKELTGTQYERQIGAAECLCNLSLGEAAVCEKIASMAGSYMITYLDNTEPNLKRCCLWIITNIIDTSVKATKTLLQMQLLQKLWSIYIVDDVNVSEFCDYAGICLQLLALQAANVLSVVDLNYIMNNFSKKTALSPGSEYHMQILFNCSIVKPGVTLTAENLMYLINFILSSLIQVNEFKTQTDKLRVLYAVRMLGNLIALYPEAFLILQQQLLDTYYTDTPSMLNKIFKFCNETLTQETLWLVRNICDRCPNEAEMLLSKVCVNN